MYSKTNRVKLCDVCQHTRRSTEHWNYVRKRYKWRQSAQTQLRHNNTQDEMLAISTQQILCLSIATAVYVNTLGGHHKLKNPV